MSSVTLVSNPTVNLSTYTWSPPGVTQLSRENKLSSLPFWAPNDKTKRHQFRLVLLKGLVPSEDAKEDSLGLLVELIPPPDDSTAATAYPGGCIVTVSLLPSPQDEASGPATAEPACVKKGMAVMNAHNLQISFPELVPARYIHDSAYLNPETESLLFQIQLQTGANIMAEQVAAPLSSLWGAISSTLSSLVKETERVVHDVRTEFAQGSGGGGGAVAAAAGAGSAMSDGSPVPWATVPKSWEGREDAWRELVRVRLGEDEGVALYGPERPMSLDEKNALVQVGVNPAGLMDLQRGFVYDRDVHEGLLESPTLNHMRYQLVPRRMKDETFWANYFWKVACLTTCVNDEQVRTMLTILNAPPAEAPKAAAPVAPAVTAEEVASHVRDATDSTTLLVEYLADGLSPDDALLVDTAAETCRGHIKQLEALFRRTDLPEAQQQAIGAALRGLRAALKQHDEAVQPASHPAETSAPPPPPPPPPPQPPAAPASIVATPATPPRPAAVAADSTPSATPMQHGASPEPAAPPSAPQPTSPTPAPVTSTAATSPAPVVQPSSQARSQSHTSQIEFPKMPWEEEEDDE